MKSSERPHKKKEQLISKTEIQKLQILISAYACNPKHGSEEAVGWNWVQAIANTHQVTVITASFHKEDIESVCDVNANPRFLFVPHKRWHYKPTTLWRRIEGSVAKPIMNLAYLSWQWGAYRLAKSLLKSQPFSLVHQLTYVGFRFPGHLWKLGLPFVWGPIGGLENTPWKLLPALGFKGAIYYTGRNLINSAQRRWLRSPRRAVVAAGPGLIAATQGIAYELQCVYGAESTIISEVVAPLNLSPNEPRTRQPGETIRIVWSGLHLPGKALNLLLEALGNISSDIQYKLYILGDGPMRGTWVKKAQNLKIDDYCVWCGMLPRNEALSIMSEAHILVITSLKDLTSTVLLEGLALGLPVVCLDHCGFSNVVTPKSGIKILVNSQKQITTDLASAIVRLAKNEAVRMALAQGALDRAQDYSLQNNTKKIMAVYGRVLT